MSLSISEYCKDKVKRREVYPAKFNGKECGVDDVGEKIIEEIKCPKIPDINGVVRFEIFGGPKFAVHKIIIRDRANNIINLHYPIASVELMDFDENRI